ncbi:MAG TPA: DUF5069 domain-containing protein [Candidatus Eremiobacteraceae bacterium]|nr:DUF5069 domain-containing protein [Candidatus Eremiobacteraceae bacterium]
MSTHVIPMVSSGTAGPLGAIHLPRLWAKLTLDAAGKLPDDYDACGTGFDQLTISDLGLKKDEVVAFVASKRPTYVEFEEWVVAHGKTDPETIRKHNENVRGYHHGDETAAKMRTAMGLKRGDVKDAVTLNTLEDLHALHSAVTK